MEQKEIDNKKEELGIEKELISPGLLDDSLDFEEEDLDKLPI